MITIKKIKNNQNEKTKISKKKMSDYIDGRERKRRRITLFFKILLIILTVVFVLCFDLLSGIGWISTYGGYDSTYSAMGVLMIVSVGIMTVSAVLCMLKFNVTAVIGEIIGFGMAMLALIKMMNFADAQGWSDPASMQPASDIFRNRVLPTVAPFVVLIVTAALQHFSYDARVKRRKKREEKEKLENMPAPKIVED
ncbi:MAG: hypothetical protein IJN85_05320 [Oscillospiraceae bacterium]|nr:hypothetical protein [Oscillospiraceae bacterium]